ncbi:MAG TPA: hypothetical protein PLH75_02925 [Amaricoccus sp.]|uniref:hypothetical protein n=1 Tax=Amaricoccus sp. TaxID=1872485 RepID=UPI001DF20395|nr:hypothetical protein [Amaricoccus sp.]MCB1371553.1 hypothetical protein [Paracoccaceae bacterium]MCC0065561.1 hypothetical protein [Rhodovulum sp.]MCB1373420.1 hypothetical protein [Paracoccaceae bacterium]MCB1402883.1 hypothetical protein [Paracoccaceae bacterium]HPG21724.1 hypothetical protein [Amaricoccus sp.]
MHTTGQALASIAILTLLASAAGGQEAFDIDVALSDDEDVTCTWVESHDTYYCEIGTFEELGADCLFGSGDLGSCCIVTADPDICGSSANKARVGQVLTQLLDDRNVLVFRRPDRDPSGEYGTSE